LAIGAVPILIERARLAVAYKHPTAANNLGQGPSETAIECLRKALQVAPDYGDAMFNWLCCCNEKIYAPRRRIIDATISRPTANRNGLLAHADH
jgi:hypothetical protein